MAEQEIFPYAITDEFCFTPFFGDRFHATWFLIHIVLSISSQTLPYSFDYEIIITVIVINLLGYIYLLSRDCDCCFAMYYIIFPKNPIS